jgi:hypothetical protein
MVIAGYSDEHQNERLAWKTSTNQPALFWAATELTVAPIENGVKFILPTRLLLAAFLRQSVEHSLNQECQNALTQLVHLLDLGTTHPAQ